MLAFNFAISHCTRIFNEASHFMGYNPVVQYVMQPILIVGVIVHFIMGFVLNAKNKQARGPVAYKLTKVVQMLVGF